MERMNIKKKILIICTGNSARSQMAEGLVNALYNDKYKTFSAGIEPIFVNPYAVKVMGEIGIDISHYRSKNLKEFYNQGFDIVITVCDNARKICPTFPGAKKMIHNSFKDPAKSNGSEEYILNIFRTVRDQINDWLSEILL